MHTFGISVQLMCIELHLASRMTDSRCRPQWPWNDDHVTGRRWMDRPRLTVGRQTLNGCRAARTGCYLLSELAKLTDRFFVVFVNKENLKLTVVTRDDLLVRGHVSQSLNRTKITSFSKCFEQLSLHGDLLQSVLQLMSLYNFLNQDCGEK